MFLDIAECYAINGTYDTTENSNSNYKIGCLAIDKSSLSWGDAMAVCNKRGGHLAHPSNSSTLNDLLSKNGVSEAWVGVRNGRNMYTPTLTVNGLPYDNGSWCGAITSLSPEISQRVCSQSLAFICQYPSGIRDCMPEPCMNGGTCVEGQNSYTCQCATEYGGAQCESKVNLPSTVDGKQYFQVL